MCEQFFVLVLMLPFVNSELFTSVSHLYSSVQAGRDLAIALRHFTRLHKEGAKLEKLKTISDKIEQYTLNIQKDPNRYIANPISAFLFIKIFTLDWDRDVEPIFLENTTSQIYLRNLKEIREYLPSYEDLEGVAAAMFRIQDTYKLSAKRLAEGFIHERYIHRLSAEDCYHLGVLAYKMKNYHHFYSWMEISLDKERTEKIENVSRLELLDYAIEGRELLGQIEQALDLVNEQLMIYPSLERALKRKETYSNILTGGKENKTVNNQEKRLKGIVNNHLSYEAICSEEKGSESRITDHLGCRYHSNNNHPLLLLQPAKEEDLHLSPNVVLYHDFISDKDIEEIKSVSMPLLERSEIINSGQGAKDEIRISKGVFLYHNPTQSYKKIKNRIQAITGLSMKESEPMQVANYGIGGFYGYHYDYINVNDDDMLTYGHRIATWLNYMSDVEEGATVFPQLGVRILPKKGAAAFWYNLYRNGSPHRMTFHGACPVLIGSKWVATYWIREREQLFNRPCSTNPKE